MFASLYYIFCIEYKILVNNKKYESGTVLDLYHSFLKNLLQLDGKLNLKF